MLRVEVEEEGLPSSRDCPNAEHLEAVPRLHIVV